MTISYWVGCEHCLSLIEMRNTFHMVFVKSCGEATCSTHNGSLHGVMISVTLWGGRYVWLQDDKPGEQQWVITACVTSWHVVTLNEETSICNKVSQNVSQTEMAYPAHTMPVETLTGWGIQTSMPGNIVFWFNVYKAWKCFPYQH